MEGKYRNSGTKFGGKDLARLRTIICTLYPSADDLQTFLGEAMGMDVVHSVAWNSGLTHIVFQLLRQGEARCWLHTLIGKIEEANPEDEPLKDFIANSIASDYIELNEPVEVSELDPFDRFGTDRYSIEGSAAEIAAVITQSFGSPESLKSFFLLYFGQRSQSRHLRSKFDWTAPVPTTVAQMLEEFSTIHYATAFIGAVQDYDGHNMILGAYLAALLQPVEEPKAEATETEPTAPAAEAPAKAVAVAETEQKLALGDNPITAAVKDQLVHMIVNMFSNSGLEMLCSAKLNERLSNITPSDTTRNMTVRVVDWCIENGLLADLIAGVLKERPHRDDFKKLVDDLVAIGFLKYE